MPRSPHRAVAVLLPLLVVVTACSAGPSQRPAVAYHDGEQQIAPAPQPPKPAPVPPLGPPAQDALSWQDCTEATRVELGVPALPPGTAFSCSRLPTTLDAPEDPIGGTARTALIRTGTGRVPLVLVGDTRGEPGTAFAARTALRLPPEVLSTFTVIGLDQRGTGGSDAADCIPPQQRDAIAGFDALATERPELDRLLDAVRVASQECLLELDERLQAYDTWRTAADLEELRLELRVPKLHAIGRGEAARLLTTYAERFPASVGRMVLDGGPDPTRDAIGQNEAQAQSAERTFDVFADDCRTRGCPLGPDPRAAVADLLAAPPPGLPGGYVVRAMLRGLSDRERWPELAAALAAARGGDGAGIEAMVRPVVSSDGADPPWLDGELIRSCNDTTLRVPPQRTSEIAADWVARFPLFGGVAAQRLVWCSGWPVPQQPLPTPRRPDVPPIPVISTAHDPLQLALGTDHLAEQLPTGVPLSWQGAGHGAVGRSECATRAVARFLVDGAVPTEGMACPG
ncbi:alpha/beta hydrolase [Saccharopolyspora sp. CA-218241]|uniref:alpha/beta hydrolase n=1 Tax=Saccharopolyspora sp. CA-218241 TaxID=3240027 RepID=UPI003D9933F3